MREWLVRDRPSTRSTRRPDIESGRPRCRGCELGQPKKVGCQPRVTVQCSQCLPTARKPVGVHLRVAPEHVKVVLRP